MNDFDGILNKSLDDFMESYKITDTEKIYSNGIEFVPIFRVKQWEEYNNKDKEIERLKEEYRITCEQKNNYISTLEGSLGIAEEKYLRLNNIIKEVREYITSQKLHKLQDTTGGLTYQEIKLLEILDKENKE